MSFSKLLRCTVASAVWIMAATPGAQAATFVWDTNTGTANAQDGGGTWVNGGSNWFDETNSLQNQPWSNAAGNTAVFGAGGAGGVVTISGTVNTNGLIFRATNVNPAYTLMGGIIALTDGSAITLFDGSSSVASNGRVVINSTLSGNNITIQKAAGSTALALMTLGTASTLSGTLTLTSADTNGLFMQVNNANAFPAATLTGGVIIGTNVTVVTGAGGTWAVPFTLSGTGAGGRGAIRLDTNVTLSGALTLAGNALITQNTSSTLSILSGNIGEAPLTPSTLSLGTQGGTGTIALAGNNTFTGGLSIDVTNVRLDNTGALNSTAPNRVTFANTALAKNLSLNGNSVTIASLASSISGLGAGTGIVRNQSATAATLTISSTTDTIFGGTLTDGTGGGALSVVKTGASAQTLSGTNSFTGGLTVNQGTLILSGTNSFAGGIAMNLGTLTISGPSTYTGGLTLNQGTVNLNSATALGAASSVFTINGGSIGNTSGAAVAITNGNALVVNADFTAALTTQTLDLGTGAVSLGTAAGTSRTIAVSGSILTLGGNISDGTTATGITKTGVGTLALGGTSTYTGLTLVTGGNLRVRSNGALGSTAAGTQLDANTRLQLENNVTITGEALITPYIENISGNNVWNGDVRAALLATLTLDAASGSLVITGNVNAASTDNTAHSFTLTGAGSGEVQGVLSNTLNFTKSGTGTWILSGANIYTSATNISAGTLQVGKNGLGQTGTGAVSVGANGTLSGTGIVRGSSFALNANATLHAGDGVTASDHGTLTFTPVSSAAHNLASGSKTFLDLTSATVSDGSFGGFDIGTTGYNTWADSVTGAGNHDRLVFNGSTGTLTVAGNIAVLPSGYTPQAGDVFNLLDWSAVLTANFSGFDVGTNLRDGSGDDGSQFDLPNISGSGLFWDVSRFTTSGNIVVVPEPGRVLLVGLGCLALLAGRRRPTKA